MLISDATERFGSRVLGATDIEDLDERIDSVIDDPDYAGTNVFIVQILIHDALMRIVQRSIVETEHLSMIRESKDLSDELSRQLMGRADFIDGERIFPAILLDDRVPVPIRKVIFAMYRSSVASLGLAKAVHDKHVLDTWLSRAICERIRDGLRQHIALAASLPGTSVPVSVIPASERMDLATIYEQHRVSREKADADLARHRAELHK